MPKKQTKFVVKDYIPNVGFISHETITPVKVSTPENTDYRYHQFPKKYGFNFPNLILN